VGSVQNVCLVGWTERFRNVGWKYDSVR